ncbi:methionine vitamin-b12 [Moniliophthora roreri]|nr:methionine vitamin-b12 [Moniliophthora roreri]
MASVASLHVKPPFRADHVGSLLRTKPLYEKRALLEEGKCSAEELREVEDKAIKHVVALQRELGIKTITDGEMRRNQFYDGVFDKLEGVVFMPERPITEFKSYIPFIGFMYATGVPHFPTFYCNDKIKRTKPFYVDQFKYIKSLVPPEDVPHIKINMCAPSWFHQRHGSDLTYDLNVYKNDKEYFDDLGAAYRGEIQELYDLGCRHVQIDDPTFAFFCHEPTVTAMKEQGVDPSALLDTYVRAINVCTQGRPKDMTVSLHICRGNYKGLHFCEGGYDLIAEQVFNGLDVDALYLEFDDARSGDFTPLKHIPNNKTVVLGLVTTKNSQLESVEALKARVEEAVNAMSQDGKRSREEALNQLCISPQCGFASVWQGNPITEEDEKKKLLVVVEAAKQIWSQ